MDVFIDEENQEAATINSEGMQRKTWIVTGSGKNFQTYPIPARKSETIDLKSKDLLKFLKSEVHFLLAFADGTVKGRWEGKSYSINHLCSDFTLRLEETNDIKKAKIFITYDQVQETVGDPEELMPNREYVDGCWRDLVKVYLQVDKDDRDRIRDKISRGFSLIETGLIAFGDAIEVVTESM